MLKLDANSARDFFTRAFTTCRSVRRDIDRASVRCPARRSSNYKQHIIYACRAWSSSASIYELESIIG